MAANFRPRRNVYLCCWESGVYRRRPKSLPEAPRCEGNSLLEAAGCS